MNENNNANKTNENVPRVFGVRPNYYTEEQLKQIEDKKKSQELTDKERFEELLEDEKFQEELAEQFAESLEKEREWKKNLYEGLDFFINQFNSFDDIYSFFIEWVNNGYLHISNAVQHIENIDNFISTNNKYEWFLSKSELRIEEKKKWFSAEGSLNRKGLVITFKFMKKEAESDKSSIIKERTFILINHETMKNKAKGILPRHWTINPLEKEDEQKNYKNIILRTAKFKSTFFNNLKSSLRNWLNLKKEK